MSVNYPSYFTESLYGIIPAGRPFSEGRFYIISISIIFNLLWCEELGTTQGSTQSSWSQAEGEMGRDPQGCVKEWVLHQKDPAAKWHPCGTETQQKSPASLALQSLAKATSVCLTFLYQSLVTSARVGRGRPTWPYKLHCMPSSSASLQNQGLGTDAANIRPCAKPTYTQAGPSTSIAQRSRQIPSPMWTEKPILRWSCSGQMRALGGGRVNPLVAMSGSGCVLSQHSEQH